MKIKDIAITGATALALAGCAGGGTDPDVLTMAVGTYTDSGSRGIYTYSFNVKTGEVTGLDTLEIKNPSYLNFSADGRHLYAVSENNDGTDCVSAIGFDAKSGEMALLGSLPTQGNAPCYVEVCGSTLLTANYMGGTMSVFSLKPDGNLDRLVTQLKGTAASIGSNERQKEAHVHTARVTPDQHWVLATDFSADRVVRMAFDGTTVNTGSVAAFPVSPVSGPRHIEFSPDGQAVYVISELSGAVTVFNYNNGALEKLQEIQSDTVDAHGSADIHISPDGRFLYTSNRLKADGIRIFSVDPQSHKLTSVGYQLTGVHPRNFVITPDGRWLLCACRDSNEILIYSIDSKSGLLKQVGKPVTLPHPVCVKFAPKG